MGKALKTERVKLISSLIYREEEDLATALTALRTLFGDTENVCFSARFDYTDYYREEFGDLLKRVIVVFKELPLLQGTHTVKISTNELEKKMSVSSRRTVNIDPGYITEAKLVLFTTKDYSHRVYIADGIFAECTLFFREGKFHPWPWTYPDYASEPMREFFKNVRDVYTRDLALLRENH